MIPLRGGAQVAVGIISPRRTGGEAETEGETTAATAATAATETKVATMGTTGQQTQTQSQSQAQQAQLQAREAREAREQVLTVQTAAGVLRRPVPALLLGSAAGRISSHINSNGGGTGYGGVDTASNYVAFLPVNVPVNVPVNGGAAGEGAKGAKGAKGGAAEGSGGAGGGAGGAAGGGAVTISYTWLGREREMTLYIPPLAKQQQRQQQQQQQQGKPVALPLVLAFHGWGESRGSLFVKSWGKAGVDTGCVYK